MVDDYKQVAAKRVLTEAGLEKAWTVFITPPVGRLHRPLKILRSIVHTLVQYSSLSESQIAYIPVLLKEIEVYNERERKYIADREAALDCPTGLVTIAGTVMDDCVVGRFNRRGEKPRILIRTTNGWLVVGPCPETLMSVSCGTQIEFVATVKPNKKDPKFGSYKNPRDAVIVGNAFPSCSTFNTKFDEGRL